MYSHLTEGGVLLPHWRSHWNILWGLSITMMCPRWKNHHNVYRITIDFTVLSTLLLTGTVLIGVGVKWCLSNLHIVCSSSMHECVSLVLTYTTCRLEESVPWVGLWPMTSHSTPVPSPLHLLPNQGFTEHQITPTSLINHSSKILYSSFYTPNFMLHSFLFTPH